jgi:hypothetical protein
MKPRACAVLVVVLLFGVFLISSGFCQDTISESVTNKIEVRKDGSAAWTVQNTFLLKTEQDVAIFQQYMTEFETQKQMYLAEFSAKITALVNRASSAAGRSMSAENFDVSISMVQTATAAYGTLAYRYDWVGFARVEGARLIVGDVFEGGFYLYSDDVLIVQYPVGYVAVSVVPGAEEDKIARTLTWYGRRNFGSGEPALVLDERAYGMLDYLLGYWPFLIAVVAAVIFAIIYLLKRGKKRK